MIFKFSKANAYFSSAFFTKKIALAKKFSDQLRQFKKTPAFRTIIQKYGL